MRMIPLLFLAACTAEPPTARSHCEAALRIASDAPDLVVIARNALAGRRDGIERRIIDYSEWTGHASRAICSVRIDGTRIDGWLVDQRRGLRTRIGR